MQKKVRLSKGDLLLLCWLKNNVKRKPQLFTHIFIKKKRNLADYALLDLLLLWFHLRKKKCGFIFPPTDFQLKQNLVAC